MRLKPDAIPTKFIFSAEKPRSKIPHDRQAATTRTKRRTETARCLNVSKDTTVDINVIDEQLTSIENTDPIVLKDPLESTELGRPLLVTAVVAEFLAFMPRRCYNDNTVLGLNLLIGYASETNCPTDYSSAIRLNNKITLNILPETQCGFRSNRSTIDMIFSLGQIQEKCIEQNMQLYAVLIDFNQTFHTVSREALWIILKKFGCTDKVINMIKALHERMQAQVVQGEDITKTFVVKKGVKQGCVRAPTLFSLYLTAMLKVAFRNVHEGIYIQTSHGADLYNVSHFKAKTRTTRYLVREMLFADDAALVAHNAADLQLLVYKFARAAPQFILKINIK
ncbi:hypothetical protein AWC38_SpisGene7681 [Stylophora pistillata]|uniref:Reverse transcriptase domain-containing protein n=1 Tax=Stylophora pistillata TaxID=50429 RepID=A0A2B4SFM5_STYPI|nr:hypothetical protein AWC38_SpisGene7681 [Stylophora pistillata]